MNPHSAHWLLLALVNIPVYLALGRIIFRDWGSAVEALRLWISADWWFSLKKQWQRNPWGTAKLPVFLLGCVVLVLLEHWMFGKSTALKPATDLYIQAR